MNEDYIQTQLIEIEDIISISSEELEKLIEKYEPERLL